MPIVDIMPLHFVIFGEPCSWKNQKRLVTKPYPKILPSKKSEQWMSSAVAQLAGQWRYEPLPRTIEMNAAIVSYLPTRRIIDADNLLGGPGDALQRAGILEDDCCIVSHDGSRRRYDKQKPRVEITLSLGKEG